MRVVGTILFLVFMFWSFLTLIIVFSIKDYYKLMRSPGLIILILGFVVILVCYSIYKRFMKRWKEDEYEYY